MTHPLQRWPRRHRRALLTGLLTAALLPVAAGTVWKPLHDDEPGGESLVAFEFAGSVDRTEEILGKWRVEGVVDEAKAIQVLDMVYPLVYALAFAGACIAASGAWTRAGRPAVATLGVAMAWVAFAAAGFDYVENLALGVSLWGEPESPWPQVGLAAASLKFAAIALSLLYAASGAFARLAPRNGSP